MLNPMRTGVLSFIAFMLLALPAFASDKAIGMLLNDMKTVREVVVYKSERRLELRAYDDSIVRNYRIALGFAPEGHKQKMGDGRTPEGRYYIDARNPDSKYHLSLRVSYPAPEDKSRARKAGVNPGGDIFIHGMPNGKEWMTWKYNTKQDWTEGCIAISNRDIREIWNLVPDGTPITIYP